MIFLKLGSLILHKTGKVIIIIYTVFILRKKIRFVFSKNLFPNGNNIFNVTEIARYHHTGNAMFVFITFFSFDANF